LVHYAVIFIVLRSAEIVHFAIINFVNFLWIYLETGLFTSIVYR